MDLFYSSFNIFSSRYSSMLNIALFRVHRGMFLFYLKKRKFSQNDRSLSLVVIRCHSLYHSLPFIVTRCNSVSLVIPLVFTRCITCLSFYKRPCSLINILIRLCFFANNPKFIYFFYHRINLTLNRSAS